MANQDTFSITLNVWRQSRTDAKGDVVTYKIDNVSPGESFLEMLDTLNETLISKGEDPVAFESDCREGICGACGFMVNGQAHGPDKGTTICQLHMRSYKDGDTLTLEPFRAEAFPVIKDLMVKRDGFDRIQRKGGYASVNVGNAPEANAALIGQEVASQAFDAAACIGCGACVAACKNSSAMLFVAAKVGQYAMLPQGQPERSRRALKMVHQMDEEGFGNCSNTLACEAACPKEISTHWIQRLNREYMRASLFSREK